MQTSPSLVVDRDLANGTLLIAGFKKGKEEEQKERKKPEENRSECGSALCFRMTSRPTSVSARSFPPQAPIYIAIARCFPFGGNVEGPWHIRSRIASSNENDERRLRASRLFPKGETREGETRTAIAIS